MTFFLVLVGLCRARILGHDVLYYPDGDGLVLRPRTGRQRIVTRFCGIDCPEHGQRGMKEARQRAVRLIKTGSYRLIANGDDIHGRTLISLVSPAGETISTQLVRAGLCYIYPAYIARCPSESTEALLNAQREALRERRGLLASASARGLAQTLLNAPLNRPDRVGHTPSSPSRPVSVGVGVGVGHSPLPRPLNSPVNLSDLGLGQGHSPLNRLDRDNQTRVRVGVGQGEGPGQSPSSPSSPSRPFSSDRLQRDRVGQTLVGPFSLDRVGQNSDGVSLNLTTSLEEGRGPPETRQSPLPSLQRSHERESGAQSGVTRVSPATTLLPWDWRRARERSGIPFIVQIRTKLI